MQAFDASSMIYAWDNYPAHQFPGLWHWLSEEIAQRRLAIPSVAYGEVSHKSPDCASWLRYANPMLLDVTAVILADAIRIKNLLLISGDSYHPKGVGENDLIIISTARAHGRELISNEARQIAPQVPSKMKIPAVCSLRAVSLACIDFLQYIKRTNAVF